MNSLLVAIDFSPASENALSYALNFAHGLKYKLNILHVIDSKSDSNVDFGDKLEKIRSGVVENFPDLLFDIIQKDGEPAQSIVDTAISTSAKLVVMGSKGHSSTHDQILGLIVQKVIKDGKLPVLVIPTHLNFAVPKNLVFASDLNPISDSNLNLLLEVAACFRSKLNLLHIFDLSKDFPVEKLAEAEKLQRLLQPIEHEFIMKAGKDIVQAIDSYSKSNNSDLIILVARKYTLIQSLFHKSVTNSIAIKAQVPFLALHE